MTQMWAAATAQWQCQRLHRQRQMRLQLCRQLERGTKPKPGGEEPQAQAHHRLCEDAVEDDLFRGAPEGREAFKEHGQQGQGKGQAQG